MAGRPKRNAEPQAKAAPHAARALEKELERARAENAALRARLARDAQRAHEPEAHKPYDPDYAVQVREAARTGFTHSEICRLLGVHSDTVQLWCMVYPEFAAAIKANRQARNDRVETALYQRAVGYEVPTERILKSSDDVVLRVRTFTHVPADTQAAKTWLERHHEDWLPIPEASPGPLELIIRGGMPSPEQLAAQADEPSQSDLESGINAPDEPDA